MPKRTVECDHCGAEIERWPSQISDHNYCSPDCRRAGQPRPTGEDHPNYKPDVEVACSWCGQSLERIPARAEEYDHHFCDSECKAAWQSANWIGQDHHQSDRLVVTCAWCGADLERPRHRVEKSTHHFCDRECKGEWWARNIRGEKHPNWQGGFGEDYGETWHVQRRAARARDDYRCWLCGLEESLQQALTGRELSVHHVRRKEKYESLREANRLGNLLTVCDWCHHALHRL